MLEVSDAASSQAGWRWQVMTMVISLSHSIRRACAITAVSQERFCQAPAEAPANCLQLCIIHVDVIAISVPAVRRRPNCITLAHFVLAAGGAGAGAGAGAADPPPASGAHMLRRDVRQARGRREAGGRQAGKQQVSKQAGRQAGRSFPTCSAAGLGAKGLLFQTTSMHLPAPARSPAPSLPLSLPSTHPLTHSPTPSPTHTLTHTHTGSRRTRPPSPSSSSSSSHRSAPPLPAPGYSPGLAPWLLDLTLSPLAVLQASKQAPTPPPRRAQRSLTGRGALAAPNLAAGRSRSGCTMVLLVERPSCSKRPSPSCQASSGVPTILHDVTPDPAIRRP